MALSASTVWECETGGADTNGGGFVTGASGTDYSKQTAAQYALTNGVTNGTTTIATVSAAADMIGNIVYVTGGTGSVTAAWYQITGASAGVSITVDRSTGLTASTGVTLNVGGALKSPGLAAGNATVAGMLIYVKYNASAFSITSASSNVSNGVISLTAGVAMIGYNTTRTPINTDALQPTLQLNVSTATLLTNGTSLGGLWINLICDGNSQTAAKAIGNNTPTVVRCTFKNFNTASAASLAFYCFGTTCSATIFAGNSIFCEATLNTATPFNLPSTGVACINCLSYGNTGASTDGFAGSSGAQFINCTSYNNGRDGFQLGAASRSYLFANCVAVNNATVGFAFSSTSQISVVNCAAFNNTSGATSGTPTANAGFITLTADPFVNGAGGNFGLNTTAGGGASLRAAGYPTSFPAGLTADFLDVGAAQHADPITMLFRQNLEGI